MKIAHYHKVIRLETGGVVRAVLDLCTVLAEAGHEVTLITPDPHDIPSSWGSPGEPSVSVVPPPTLPGQLFSRAARRDLADRLADADVLHLHGMWTPANVQFGRIAGRRNLPYVYSVHGMLDDWCMAQRHFKKRVYLGAVGRRLLHDAAAVHCTAQAELDQAKKWFPGGHGVVIPLVFDLAPFESLPGPGPAREKFPELTEDRPFLLFLSRIHYKKGIELLIDAAHGLREAGHDVLIGIAGTGDEPYIESLRQRAKSRGVDSCVRFLGFVSGIEKISLYQAADVFVLPTSQENFGFVLFEALAAGTPVVTTRGADTWPEMEASGGAVIADPNPEALVESISALLADPDRRSAMRSSGRQWVFDQLSGQTIVQQFEDLYRSAAQGR